MEDTSKENAPVNEKDLTEEQKRYRDTAFNILWYVIKNSQDKETNRLFKDIKQVRMLLSGANKNTLKTKFNFYLLFSSVCLVRQANHFFISVDIFFKNDIMIAKFFVFEIVTYCAKLYETSF